MLGRYAPSPSGDLHLGNLRTAVIARAVAEARGAGFALRIDDIDPERSSIAAAERQLADLAAVGVTPTPADRPIARQQQTLAAYDEALRRLTERGLVYECFCSRRDIAEATRAPHARPGVYPGTCRGLTHAERDARREELAVAGRVASLRLRAAVERWTVIEEFAGGGAAGSVAGGRTGGVEYTDEVDDFVLRRGGNGQPGSHDADFSYNLAVVVDDHLAGVDHVVRGDDLLSSAPRQAYLAHLLGWEQQTYVHVPLVLNAEGKRLAKRDGAVTLRDVPIERARQWIYESLGAAWDGNAFDLARLPREPVVFEGV